MKVRSSFHLERRSKWGEHKIFICRYFWSRRQTRATINHNSEVRNMPEEILRSVWERKAAYHVECESSVSWNERRKELHDSFHSTSSFFASSSLWSPGRATKTSSMTDFWKWSEARWRKWPLFWQSVCMVCAMFSQSPQVTYRENVWKYNNSCSDLRELFQRTTIKRIGGSR